MPGFGVEVVEGAEEEGSSKDSGVFLASAKSRALSQENSALHELPSKTLPTRHIQ